MKKIVLLVLLISFNLIKAQVELKWAGAFQSNNTAVGRSVVADKFGNVYSTGYYNGIIDLDPGTGVSSFTTGSGQSFFVTKMDVNGNLIWAKNFTGPVNVYSSSIGLDSLGNVVTMGFFESNILNNPIDFDPGTGVQNLAALGSTDAFILKLDPNGNFMWVRQVGGVSASVNPYSMDIDKHGNVHVVGWFLGTVDFNPGVSVNTISSSGSGSADEDGFIFKLDTYGNYIWAGAFISSMDVIPNDIKVDNNGNMFLVGRAKGTVDFDPGPSSNTMFLGTFDNFICKLDLFGNFIWVKNTTNNSTANINYNDITTDSFGDCYIIGDFNNTCDFDPGPGTYYLSTTPGNYSYILKLSSNGNFIWANFLSGIPSGLDITTDIFDNLFFTSAGGFNTKAHVVKLNTNGNILWKEESGSTSLATAGHGHSSLIYVDSLQNVYITGQFSSGPYDFDPNPGVYNLSSSNNAIFIQKLGPCTSVAPAAPTDITPLANKSICANATTTLTIADNNLFVNWYSSPTSTVVLSTDSFYVTPPLAAGTHTYYVDSKDCLFSLTRTPITITVNPTPTISISNGTICSGQTYTLNPTGADFYTMGSGVVSPTNTTIYPIIGVNNIGNCSTTTTVEITVNPNPVISAWTPNSLVCIDSAYVSLSGAATYTISNGSNGPTTWINLPAGLSTYTVIGTSALGCVDSVGIVLTFSVITTPIISANSGTICSGSSFSIIPTGAAIYTVTPSPASSSGSVFIVSPSATTNYTINGSTGNGCSYGTTNITVTVDPTCQDVWPGDANSDGTADNLDVLELGLHYTQTGTPRASTSNTWQSYFATNWTGTITNGKNLNHSDCNGDGTINDNDTLAIYTNYGLTHAFKPTQTNTVNPQLSIVPDQAYVTKGNWGTASIYLGDGTSPISNINGLTFTVDFDNTLFETNNIYIEYQNSFLDAGQNLRFRKLDFSNGKIFTATTHTLNNNVSGNGKIATLHYQIKSNLTTDEVLNIALSQANQSNASGAIVPLTSGTGSLMAIGASVGLQELNGNSISISPNPSNGSLTIRSKTELQKVEVITVTGQILLSEVPTNVSHTLHLDNFANGIYIINLYQNNSIVKREKVVLNK